MLSRLYNEQLSDGEEEVGAIFFNTVGEVDVSLLRTADIVVEQVFNGLNDIVSDNIGADCLRIPYPMALGPYFWPYGSGSHVSNKFHEFAPHFPAGPWPAEAGDSYLNRLIARKVPTEAAVNT